MLRLVVASALLVLVCAGCGTSESDDKEPAGDIAASDTVASDVAPGSVVFGEACTTNEDCESGVCNEFGQTGPLCTIECTTADECPEGSEGKKCNQKGVCKP
jgi:hypothetical protein